MKCICIQVEEQRIADGFAEGKLEKPKKAGAVKYVQCEQTGLSISKGETVLLIAFNTHFEGVKKPFPVRIKAEFCPFCGGAAV